MGSPMDLCKLTDTRENCCSGKSKHHQLTLKRSIDVSRLISTQSWIPPAGVRGRAGVGRETERYARNPHRDGWHGWIKSLSFHNHDEHWTDVRFPTNASLVQWVTR